MKQKIYTHRPCPVCGCNIANPLFPVCLHVEDKGLPNQYEAVQCDYCGMCYADTTATGEDYERYYREFNYYGKRPGTIKAVELQRYQAIANLLRQHSDLEREILDVGFGDGGLLYYLKNQGFLRIAGMDPSADSVDLLNKNGINAFCGSLQQKPEISQQGRYDVVISTNVLEHLFSPKLGIQNLRALLKENGYAILTFPLFDELEEYRLPLCNLVNHEHINYFSRTSIRFLFELMGFRELVTQKIEIERDAASITYGLLGVYQYIDMRRENWSLPYRDQRTGAVLQGYYNKQQHLLQEQLSFLQDLERTQTPIALWGAGTYLTQIWEVTILPQCNIVMIVDGSVQKQGTIFGGMTIQPPDALRGFEGEVLVSAMRSNEEILEILKQLDFRGGIKLLGLL